MPPSCRSTPTASSICRSATRSSCWHLSQAALAGRDIYYDQRYAHNLTIRRVLEAVLTHPSGTDPAVLDAITHYTKLFWIHTGPFNNLTARKFVLGCTPDAFAVAVKNAAAAGAPLPLEADESIDQLLARLHGPLFDKDFEPVVTNKSPGAGADILKSSSNNLYVGLEMADLDGFEERFPLNSRLVKTAGGLVEEPYRIGGKYSDQIAFIVEHLEAAIPYATEAMAEALARARDVLSHAARPRIAAQYDIAWVRDQHSHRGHDERLHRGLHGRPRRQGLVGSARLLRASRRRRRPPRPSPSTRSGSRTGCPGTRSTASRRSPASPPARSRSSWKAATRRR